MSLREWLAWPFLVAGVLIAGRPEPPESAAGESCAPAFVVFADIDSEEAQEYVERVLLASGG